MSLKKISKDQPDKFEFDQKSLEAAKKILSNYPKGKEKSAVMALLYIAQRQNNNWIPLSAIKCIAKFLNMPYIKVYEVATFYSMYNLSPVGNFHVQICTTTPCMIRGAYKIVEVCKKKISEKENVLSENGNCSCPEAECGIWPRHKCKCKNPSPIPDWPFTNCAGLPTPIIYILATLCAGIGIFIFPIPQVWNKLRKNRGEPGADMVEAYGGARVGRAARRRK